jgi:hypothetical protein
VGRARDEGRGQHTGTVQRKEALKTARVRPRHLLIATMSTAYGMSRGPCPAGPQNQIPSPSPQSQDSNCNAA